MASRGAANLDEKLESLSLNDSLKYLHNKDERLNIVTIGKTGDGKSATFNTLISYASPPRPNFFKEEQSPNSVTKSNDQCNITLFERNFHLIDTMGFFDTEMTPERNTELHLLETTDLESDHKDVLDNLKDVVNLCTDGIHAFLFVVDGTGRMSLETKETINVIQRFFGFSMLDHCIFVLTKADRAQNGTLENMQETITNYLLGVGYANIGNRFVHFDNRGRSREQVLNLLEKIEENLLKKKGLPYTNVAFQRAQKDLEEGKLILEFELQEQMSEHLQIATDGVLAEFDQELVDLEDELERYNIHLPYLFEDANEEKQFCQDQIDRVKNKIIELNRRREREVPIAFQNAMARCTEECKQNINQKENKIQEQKGLLNESNQKVSQLQDQVRRRRRH